MEYQVVERVEGFHKIGIDGKAFRIEPKITYKARTPGNGLVRCPFRMILVRNPSILGYLRCGIFALHDVLPVSFQGKCPRKGAGHADNGDGSFIDHIIQYPFEQKPYLYPSARSNARFNAARLVILFDRIYYA